MRVERLLAIVGGNYGEVCVFLSFIFCYLKTSSVWGGGAVELCFHPHLEELISFRLVSGMQGSG